MLGKILKVLRKMLVDVETAAVIRKDAATALVGHLLNSSEEGYFVVTMPATHGMLVKYSTIMPYECTIQSFAGHTITPETGEAWPMRNRYLGADASKFFDVIKDPTVTDEGVELTSATYGEKSKAGAEAGSSWFYIPAGLSILFKYTSGAAANNIVTRVDAQLVPGMHEHDVS